MAHDRPENGTHLLPDAWGVVLERCEEHVAVGQQPPEAVPDREHLVFGAVVEREALLDSLPEFWEPDSEVLERGASVFRDGCSVVGVADLAKRGDDPFVSLFNEVWPEDLRDERLGRRQSSPDHIHQGSARDQVRWLARTMSLPARADRWENESSAGVLPVTPDGRI